MNEEAGLCNLRIAKIGPDQKEKEKSLHRPDFPFSFFFFSDDFKEARLISLESRLSFAALSSSKHFLTCRESYLCLSEGHGTTTRE